MDSLVTGANPGSITKAASDLRIAVPAELCDENTEDAVRERFHSVCDLLRNAGCELVDLSVPALQEARQVYQAQGYVAYEAWQGFGELIEARGGEFDPRVAERMRLGEALSAAHFKDLCERRVQLVADAGAALDSFDLAVAPTVPILAREIDALASDEDFFATNRLCLYNTCTVNVIDGCAISVPMKVNGLGAALMCFSTGGRDESLLSHAVTIQQLSAL